MAWALLHHNSADTTLQTSLAFGTNPTAGNLLAAIIANPSSTTFTSPSDTYGNAWVDLGQFVDTGARTTTVRIWAAINKGGAGTNTFSWTGSANDVFLSEFTGAPATLVQDGSMATADIASTTSITTPSYTPTVTGDLLLNFIQESNAVTSFNGVWSLGEIDSNGNGWGFTTGALAAIAANATSTNGAATSVIVGIKAATPVAPVTPRRAPLSL